MHEERFQIAKAAFELQEWIDGADSGGTIPPRETVGVDFFHTNGYSEVTFTWKYPELVHPCSDVTYHNSEPDKEYEVTYIITDDNKMTRKGSDHVFDTYGDSDWKTKVEEYCREWGVSLQN